MAPKRRYDFVIVGGGSAGCALANRLSVDPSTRVLVLEAGRPDWRFDVYIHMPTALAFPIGNRFYDWRYKSEPEPFMGGRQVYHARGRVLGGSSSINGMIFQRGNPLDYERWAADSGMDTWSYAQDRREWVEAIGVARRILGQPALAPFNDGETSPGASVSTPDEILDWVRRDAETALHPSCTARMGVDGASMVDPRRCACTAWMDFAWSTRPSFRTSRTPTSTRRS